MDAYDTTLAPRPFGLNNTGVICYLNSFLQVLAGCTAFTRTVLDNAGYVARTRTGQAVLQYIRAFAPQQLPEEGGPDISGLSARVLAALVLDLRARRPLVRFGGGQESASEALIHLLDMMEPPPGDGPDVGPEPEGIPRSPVTELFLHRFRCDLHCRRCHQIVSKDTDNAVVFNLFHIDSLRDPPQTVADFSKAVRLQVSATTDYGCPECKQKTEAVRIYSLSMVPEVIVCAFNLYTAFGSGARRARYFPERLEFPAIDSGKLVFRLVGQVEHAGTLAGGHYWARGLRADGKVYVLNDTGVSPGRFEPTPETYLLAYHYAGAEEVPSAAGADPL